MTTAEYLTQLIDSKEDMKSAIESKGVAVTGGLSTYADAINKIGKIPAHNIRFMGSDFSSAPILYTKSYTTMFHMFDGCKKLVNVPSYDTSNVGDMSYMFADCISLVQLPESFKFRGSKAHMFEGCTSLTTVPAFGRGGTSMFKGCTSLTTVPAFGSGANSMFEGCTSLTDVPAFELGGNLSNMFEGCTSLTDVNLLFGASATNMSYMFNGCTSLTDVIINSSKPIIVEAMTYTFNNCPNLIIELPLIDASKMITIAGLFGNDINYNITTLGGFKDLGLYKNLQGTRHFIDILPNLTYESIMNVINNLYDRASAGMSVLALKINSATEKLLSINDKMIAINKGWTIEYDWNS